MRKPLSLFAVTLLSAAVLTAMRLAAAPFETTIPFVQPDGTAIEIWGQGDEFYAVFETPDGYSVVYDQATKAYAYAALSQDGRLVPSALLVGKADPVAQGLEKHLRMAPVAIQEQTQRRFKRWDDAMENSAQWAQKKADLRAAEQAAAAGRLPLSPPSFTTTGNKTGLCLLIDFPDDTNTVSQAKIIEYCNGDNNTNFNNNGSIKKYFQDISNNQLTYTNIVTAYVRMAQPKSTYNDTSKDAGNQANYLIRDAIALMKALPNYATEIAPAFSNLTRDASNRAVACNVFYAGGNGGVWSYGLWPHSWSLYTVGQQELVAGVFLYKYQITNIGSSLTLGTFCHENGHMLCGFPDIYDYEYDSSGGAGAFCLMNSGGSGTNPVQACAYLKRAAGWATTVDLNRTSDLTASLSASGDGFNTFYRFVKPGVPTEYYLVENRQKRGRDATLLPGSGIAIWHIDEAGNKNNQSLVYNTTHANYEATLVQADNKWDLQKYANSGDAYDLFHSGNTAPGYLNRFNDTDEPRARWWDGTVSGIQFSGFSANATNMTFTVKPSGLVIVSTSPLATGFAGVPYSRTLTATNGTPPYSWAVVSNALPAGLTLSSSGVVSGTPTAETNSAFRIAATDSAGLCATNLMTLTTYRRRTLPLAEPFENSTKMPAYWTQDYLTGTRDWAPRAGGYNSNPAKPHGGSYNAWLYISTANAPNRKTRLVTPMLDFGSAPSNAQLVFWHCMVSRSSTAKDALRVYVKTGETNAWSLLATYTNAISSWTQQTVALPNPNRTFFIAFEGTANYGYGVCVDDVMVVDASSAPLITTPGTLSSNYIGDAVSETLTAIGGTAPYTWAVVSNALPPGLSLSSGGVLSGQAPATATNLSFRVRVEGANGSASTNLFALAVVTRKSVPYVETFENAGKLPADWTQTYVTGTTSWGCTNGGIGRQNPSSAHGGSYNALFYSNVLGRTTKLISPAIDFGLTPQVAQLSFWHCMKGRPTSYQDTLRVYYRTAATNAWVLLEAYTNEVASWTERTLSLPAPSRSYFIAFEGTANYGYGVCVDDVTVSLIAPYTVWKTTWFTTAEIAAGVITGDADDPDNDGIANLQEYAWGLNPRLHDTAGLPFGGVWSPYLMLNYRQNKQATDLVFAVESCTNLLEGLWSADGVSEISRADSNLWWQVTTRHDVPVTHAPSRFLRLRITRP